jgi:hypothetical protein
VARVNCLATPICAFQWRGPFRSEALGGLFAQGPEIADFREDPDLTRSGAASQFEFISPISGMGGRSSAAGG